MNSLNIVLCNIPYFPISNCAIILQVTNDWVFQLNIAMDFWDESVIILVLFFILKQSYWNLFFFFFHSTNNNIIAQTLSSVKFMLFLQTLLSFFLIQLISSLHQLYKLFLSLLIHLLILSLVHLKIDHLSLQLLQFLLLATNLFHLRIHFLLKLLCNKWVKKLR